MKLRTLSALAIALVAATAAFVPTAQAGNVGWSVSVGGPGFAVAAGQPGYYGGHGYYRAPYHPYARRITRSNPAGAMSTHLATVRIEPTRRQLPFVETRAIASPRGRHPR